MSPKDDLLRVISLSTLFIGPSAHSAVHGSIAIALRSDKP
jgi:hypothetical protein